MESTSTDTILREQLRFSGWIAALAGVWILASPFVLSGAITAGTAMWSNVAAGVVALVLAAYAGYALHSGR